MLKLAALFTDNLNMSKPAKVEMTSFINERTDFGVFEKIDSNELHINCKDIKTINSFGIRQWLITFKKLRESGKKLKFYSISPTMMRQLSFTRGLISPMEVDSICAEFICYKCNNHTVKDYSKNELQKSNFSVSIMNCPNCKSPMEFDDLPEEYFSFFKKA